MRSDVIIGGHIILNGKARNRKRGQMEMVGLVFIVAIVVIGMIIYLLSIAKQGTGKSSRDLLQSQKSPTFLTAIAATDVPACNNLAFDKVVQKCINAETYCTNGNPCEALSLFLDGIAQDTLLVQGNKYNLSIEGTTISTTYECDSASNATLVYAASKQPINTNNGASVNLVLSLCK